MDIKTIKQIATKLPASIAILFRGPTGIGKSHIARQIADDLGLPFVDVRGSTMEEAQVSGIPDFESSKTTGVATFCLPSWYVRACREPVVLMLDELNRSMPAVMQSFFQIVLDRELGNNVEGEPLRLHPNTRIIAAVNSGAEYDVNDMDPALLRRFWVTDVEANPNDWIQWARGTHDPTMLDFIQQHPEHFNVDTKNINPGTVIPTPASWTRLNESLKTVGIVLAEHAGSRPPLLYPISQGFVGVEASIAMSEFIARLERNITAEQVIEGKISRERAEALNASESLAVITKLADHCKENEWTAEHAQNIASFLEARSKEQLLHGYNEISRTSCVNNITALHRLIGEEVTNIIRPARGLEPIKNNDKVTKVNTRRK